MGLSGIGQGVLSNQIKWREDIRQEQTAMYSRLPLPGESVNTDRVEISPFAQKSVSATPPSEKPQMFNFFSKDIESAIGGIENSLKNARMSQATGSMLNGQKGGVINEPEKGNLSKDQARVVESARESAVKREKESNAQSLTSASRATLTAVVDQINSEQLNRNSQASAHALF